MPPNNTYTLPQPPPLGSVSATIQAAPELSPPAPGFLTSAPDPPSCAGEQQPLFGLYPDHTSPETASSGGPWGADHLLAGGGHIQTQPLPASLTDKHLPPTEPRQHHCYSLSSGSPLPDDTRLPANRGKRPLEGLALSDMMDEGSRAKKPRTGASPLRTDPRDDGPVTAPAGLDDLAGPPMPDPSTSPLFFSHASPPSWGTTAVRPPLGFRTTPDIAMAIVTSMAETPSVTTLQLPQPPVQTAPQSPARTAAGTPTPGSMGSSMDSMPSLTPDTRWPKHDAGLQALTGLDVLELLDHDARPTFLIDLADPSVASRPRLQILFHNAALRATPRALRLLATGKARLSPEMAEMYDGFRTWATSPSRAGFAGGEGQEPAAPSYGFGGFIWTSVILRKRFRVVSGSVDPDAEPLESILAEDETVSMGRSEGDKSPDFPITPEMGNLEPPDYFGDTRQKHSRNEPMAIDGIIAGEQQQQQPGRATFDWTTLPMTGQLPHHIGLARSIDWAATPLGPIENWPPALKSMSNLVMGSPNPAALYWGVELVAIYNEAYIDIAGQKHPGLMGHRYPDCWPEIWPEIEPSFRAAWESGQSVMKHDNQYFINRHGYLEEAFFTWSVVPILGSEGEVVGLYNPVFEGTRRKVTERRMFTLREIGERTASATTVKGFWPQVQKGLEYNEYDVPFALVYSVEDHGGDHDAYSVHSPSSQAPRLVLEGSIGVPENHAAAVKGLDLSESDEGFARYMRQSIANKGEVVVLSEDDGTLPHGLISGLDWRGYKDPCRTIAVFPVVPNTANESVVGFIIMGMNPRRPYDDDYRLFIHLLSRQLATSMASVVLFEDEIKRGQRAATRAAMDRHNLLMQLQKKSREANESEYNFSRMAEFAPVGMFIADADGRIDYCNDTLWHIAGVASSAKTENAWMDSVRAEDRGVVDEAWARLLNERVTVSVEFRFMHSRQDGDVTMDTWALMSAYPDKDADGNPKSIFGCITDISSQKWAEKVQNERREEAVELKRQQENFIDITSHEMRNPLSAVLQCADEITSSISAFADHHDPDRVTRLLEECLDAANTINLCSTHQKRIVDDISTLSKLDSNLLGVAPIDEQPVRVIQRALRMFESELLDQDIDFDFVVDSSFEELGVKWAKMDPSRFLQILINLMTNAIRFTQSQERRAITVKVGVSRDTSGFAASDHGAHYFDRHYSPAASTWTVDDGDGEWGSGDRITIHCSVEDTGPGMAKEELEDLFQRFQHAMPRTHVQYGGSGLGLFICRILTEMQGGQMGVSSQPGRGSKLSFYVQSRISTSPPEEPGRLPSPLRVGRRAHPPPAAEQDDAAAAAAASVPFDVLIVEDNIVNQKVLQRQLSSYGSTTFVANHGEEALQALERSKYWAGQETDGIDISVILMDLEMPVMDGMTCTRRIRELEQKGTIVQHIPIIAVTAYSRPEQIADAKAAGIDDVISKPFRMPDLLPRIEGLIGKRQPPNRRV